ncbi:MAG TPA: hypothetical protein DCR15_15870 [Arthrobacter bacterium]|nr:hypothetical protein [Arthrobacter sp.]
MIETLTSGPGLVTSILVPHTSQAGFVDASGAVVSSWYYVATTSSLTLSGSLAFAPQTKAFLFPAGPTTVELETLPLHTPPPVDGPDVPEWELPGRLSPAVLSATYAPASGSANYAPKTTATVQGLPAWARKRMLATLAQGPCRVLCVGDSTTAGVYSDSYTTATGSVNQGGPNSYPAQLAKRLTAMGIPAEYSFCLPGHGGNDDSRWSLGTWGYAAYGAGMNAAITSATAGQTATVTPTNVANTYIVYFFGDSGTGVFTAQATGGVSVSINTVETTAGIYGSAVVTASATASTNTITFTNTSGTVFVVGVESYDSANPNKVRIMGAGVGGSKATVWNNTSNPGALNFIKGYRPGPVHYQPRRERRRSTRYHR